MFTSNHAAIRDAIESSQCRYHRLVLLVGNSGSGKTRILQDVAVAVDTTVINVNLELANQLLELTAKQRALRLPRIFAEITSAVPQPIMLDNLEVLFEPNLKQDPLRLLQDLSRNTTVVAAWNGSYNDGRLWYAEMGHPEYRSYNSVDALVVVMGETNTAGPA